MSYSFFGTSANDQKLLKDCLKSMKNQSVKPKEIILVDAGDYSQKETIINLIDDDEIDFKYFYEKNITRIMALNLAIENSNSSFLLRFDARTRFNKKYAENAILILQNGFNYTGGVPDIIPEDNSNVGKFCAQVLKRAYIFLYPRHRIKNYTGQASSVYLGCFNSEILKKIKYRESISVTSEDSLISADFSERGFSPYLSNKLKLSYKCRSSLIRILKLFNTYGYCRFNAFLGARKVHSLKRYFIILILLIIQLITISIFGVLAVKIFLIILFLYNLISEILSKNIEKNPLYIPFAMLCQFSWGLGFIWGILNIYRVKKVKTNFIK